MTTLVPISVTMPDLIMISMHVDHLSIRGLRPNTIAKRAYHLRRFSREGPNGLVAATTDDVEAWLSRPISPKSKLLELSHLRAFYRWGITRGHLTTDPTIPVVSPRIPRYLPRPIPEDQLRTAVLTAYQPVRLWLVLAGWAGLRACEIAQLRVEAIHADDRLIIIENGKGGRQDTVPMCDTVLDELASVRLPGSGWCWTMPTDRRRHVTPSRVSKLANDYLRALGGGATLHMLRHRFGTEVYRATKDLRVTQEVLRHQSPMTTTLYTKLTAGDRGLAVDALPGLDLPAA